MLPGGSARDPLERWHSRRNIALNGLTRSRLCNLQIVSCLQVQPIECLSTEVSRQPQRRVARDAAPLEEYVIDARWRDSEDLRECRRTQAHRFHELPAQNFSGMYRLHLVFGHRTIQVVGPSTSRLRP